MAKIQKIFIEELELFSDFRDAPLLLFDYAEPDRFHIDFNFGAMNLSMIKKPQTFVYKEKISAHLISSYRDFGSHSFDFTYSLRGKNFYIFTGKHSLSNKVTLKLLSSYSSIVTNSLKAEYSYTLPIQESNSFKYSIESLVRNSLTAKSAIKVSKSFDIKYSYTFLFTDVQQVKYSIESRLQKPLTAVFSASVTKPCASTYNTTYPFTAPLMSLYTVSNRITAQHTSRYSAQVALVKIGSYTTRVIHKYPKTFHIYYVTKVTKSFELDYSILDHNLVKKQFIGFYNLTKNTTTGPKTISLETV